MKTAIILTIICLWFSACRTTKTLDGLVGQDRAQIEARWGKATMEYKDPKTGNDILGYSNITHRNIKSSARPAPPAESITGMHLLYLSKDSICYRWTDVNPSFWPTFESIVSPVPVGNMGK